MKLYGLNKEMGSYIRKDIEHWIEAELNWELVPNEICEMELLPGVFIHNWGSGHAFGMMGLRIMLKKIGAVILASDALAVEANMGPPVRMPRVPYDTLGYARTAEQILKLKRLYNAKVWCGHDEKQFDCLIKSDAGYYE
jgi:glyoxylase-like metal-dependent hydrolase (beta-lactamase superfamily II)